MICFCFFVMGLNIMMTSSSPTVTVEEDLSACMNSYSACPYTETAVYDPTMYVHKHCNSKVCIKRDLLVSVLFAISI